MLPPTRLNFSHILARHTTRMLSTIVGKSGRKYEPMQLIQRHVQGTAFDIYLAHCDHRGYVLKPVERSVFEHLQDFKNTFSGNQHMRIHFDESEEHEHPIVVYEYFKTDLLALVGRYPDLPRWARKQILREVAKALSDMHGKDWIHLDVKPDNVFVNWWVDATDEDKFHLDKVQVGDMDFSFNTHGNLLLHSKSGNTMWRSPEGLLGRCLVKASDVFSFGLLTLYVMTRVLLFHINKKEWEEDGDDPDWVVLSKYLRFFGPLPQGLVEHVNDQEAADILLAFRNGVAEMDGVKSIEHWSEKDINNFDQDTKDFVMRITKLDPAERPTMLQVAEDPFFEKD